MTQTEIFIAGSIVFVVCLVGAAVWVVWDVFNKAISLTDSADD